MLGGISFPNRDRLSFDCSNNFEHKLVKGDLYHLCIKKDDENFNFHGIKCQSKMTKFNEPSTQHHIFLH